MAARAARLGLCALAMAGCRAGPPADSDDAAAFPEASGALLAENSAGRHGAYYLPSRGDDAVPVAVLFHPTGGDGASFLAGFRDLAEQGGIALVAPDSRVSPAGEYTWEVGTEAGEITEDLAHAEACLAEVLAMDVGLDPAHSFAVGHSGGASSAPYFATNRDDFAAFAVLHGGLFPSGFGDAMPRAFLATGEDDTLRPPSELAGYRDDLAALGFDVTLTIYPGGHGISDAERADLIGWALGG